MEEHVVERPTWMLRNPDNRENTKTKLRGDQEGKRGTNQLVPPSHTVYPIHIRQPASDVSGDSHQSGRNDRTLTQRPFGREP